MREIEKKTRLATKRRERKTGQRSRASLRRESIREERRRNKEQLRRVLNSYYVPQPSVRLDWLRHDGYQKPNLMLA